MCNQSFTLYRFFRKIDANSFREEALLTVLSYFIKALKVWDNSDERHQINGLWENYVF